MPNEVRDAPDPRQRRGPAPVSPDGGLDDALLVEAVRNCGREPIGRPGAIQPHGVLFVLDDGPGGALLASSDNAAVDRLDAWLDAPSARRVAEAASGLAPGRRVRAPGLARQDGAGWNGLLSRRDGGAPVLLSLEPDGEAGAAATPPDVLEAVNEATEALLAAASVDAAARIATEAVRRITGFDRVMAYAFEADWSGVVVGESLRDPAANASFLGLHFPASDIPPQARALYGTDRIRMIPDSRAVPVPIAGRNGHAGAARLDLTDVPLRAVSPIHLAYLANMGVRASMSVAVRNEGGELWGLLACHNETEPLRPPPAIRTAAELIGRALAARAASLRAESEGEGRVRAAALRERIATELGDPDADAAASPLAVAIAAAVDADLALLAEGDHVLLPGNVPPPPGLVPLLDRLASDGTVVTDHLADPVFGAVGEALVRGGHAGLLAHRVDAGTESGTADGVLWLLWFRGERRRHVAWAGNPDKTATVTADGLPILSPRRSFASWNEEVRGHSEPFTPADRAAAAAIADSVARALARRSAAVARAVGALRARNEQIRFFADAAVHDLREPLWQIQVFAGMLREELGGAEGSEIRTMAEVIESSSMRMREIVDDLSRFALAGADPSRLRLRRIDELAGEAIADLAERLASAGGRIDTDGSAAAVVCDGAQIRRVFQNLLSNSIKYRDRTRPLRVAIAVARRERGQVAIDYRDNGAGFDDADRERIFEPFRRLYADDDGSGADGLGLGLAICRRIVEGHGGQIAAEGRPGEGARFTVLLPEAGPSP